MMQRQECEGSDALKEFQSNCRALSLKANTTLMKCADNISSGEVVDLSQNYVGANGLQAMTTLLSKNGNLSELRLPQNGLNNDSIVFLCRSLKQHPRLRVIDLSGNTNVSLTSGVALLSLIQHNPALCEVNLAGTQVPEAVLKKIAIGCEHNIKSQKTPDILLLGVTPSVVVNEPISRAPRLAAPSVNLNPNTTVRNITRAGKSDTVRREVWDLKEKDLRAALAMRLHEGMERESAFLPEADPQTGWRLLEVAIVAPPCIFDSEIKHLVDEVFPRLNQELQCRKVQLLPLVNTSPESPGSHLRHLHFTVGCDIVADVKRSRLIVIELIGDRAGSYEQQPANVMFKSITTTAPVDSRTVPLPRKLPTLLEKDAAARQGASLAAAPPLHPVMYEAHRVALESTRWIVVATRRNTKYMHAPPSLAPLLSAEPMIEHPDAYRALVKKVAPSSALRPSVINSTSSASAKDVAVNGTLSGPLCQVNFDRAVEESKWQEHVAFRDHLIESLPVPELLIEDYPAKVSGIGKGGEIYVDELEQFVEAVYSRLHLVLTALFPMAKDVIPEEKVAPAAFLTRVAERAARIEKIRTSMKLYVTNGLVKKTLSNRLNLYVVTPPSRNTLILHGAEASTLAVNMFAAATHLAGMPYAYTVGVHSTSCNVGSEEPTDLRTVMVSLISQLTSNHGVLRYLELEMDVERLQKFFTAFLSSGGSQQSDAIKPRQQLTDGELEAPAVTASTVTTLEFGDSNSSRVFVLFLEGLDALMETEPPCDALRVSEDTGIDIWGSATDGESSTAPTKDFFLIPQKKQSLGFLPRCLARNVRIVASCHTSSELLPVLSDRGRDSVEVLGVGCSSANDIEQMLSPERLEPLGVFLSEDEYVMALRKDGAKNHDYMCYLIEALRRNNEASHFGSQSQLIQMFPETLGGAVRDLYDTLCATFGAPLIRKAFGIFRVSRWSIPEPLLRSLVKLPPQRFREFLRLLRAVTDSTHVPLLANEIGNNLLNHVAIRSPAFLAFLSSMENQEENPDVIDKERKVWHGMLAHRLLTAVKNVILTADELKDWGLAVMHPYERHAVKELPYHLAEAGLWQVFDKTVLSVPFMCMVYRNRLGYQFVRDLIHAFNLRYGQYLLGEDTADSTLSFNTSTVGPKSGVDAPQSGLTPTLSRLREYVYFARANGALLTEYPHLVCQVCMEKSNNSGFVLADAHAYLNALLRSPGAATGLRLKHFFTVLNPHRRKVHHGPLTDMHFTVPAKILVTGSVDRSLCWVDPAQGTVRFHARHPTTRVNKVFASATSTYVGALAEDRSLYIYDAASGKLITRNEGELFKAPIVQVSFTARGRYYLVATSDLVVRVYDSEKSRLCITLSARELMSAADSVSEDGASLHAKRNYLEVVPHPWEDEEFVTIANSCLFHWRVNETRDGAHAVGEKAMQLRGPISQALWIGNPEDVLDVAPTMADSQVGCQEPRIMAVKGKPSPYILLQFLDSPEMVLINVLMRTSLAEFTLPSSLQRLDTAVTPEVNNGDVPPLFSLSPDRMWLAVAQSDGRVILYRVPWHSFAVSTEVVPVRHFQIYAAFRLTSSPRIVALKFNASSSGIIAVGNERHLKYWSVSNRGNNSNSSSRPPSALVTKDGTAGVADEVLLADGECVFSRPVTSCDSVVKPTTVSNSADLAVGDVDGNVTLLRCWGSSRYEFEGKSAECI